MANLMNDRSDMPALYKKYQGFRVPAFQVLLGEGKKDLKSQLNGQTEQLEISLSLDNASSAVFQISNAYDFKNHKFRGEIMNSLTLGNLVQVNIGYGSSLDSVFCGYIHSVKQDFQEMPRLSVTVLDVRRLMQSSQHMLAARTGGTYSEVFQNVMEPYKKLYDRLVVDRSAEKDVSGIKQSGSDLEFVKKLAKAANREFLVFGDQVYFRRISNRSAALTLTWGQDLMSFAKESIYASQKLTVAGIKKGSKDEVVKATREVKTESSVISLVSGGLEEYIWDPSVNSQEKADQKADALKEEREKRVQGGSGSCVGLPQLVPGRTIKIAGLSSGLNGEYMLRQVSHTLGGDGFLTTFEIGGFG